MAFARIEKGIPGQGLQISVLEGSPFFITEYIARLYDLKEGQELTEEECAQLRLEQARHDCRAKALSLLAMREHTAFELRQKLGVKGFEPEVISSVLDDLKEENLLSEYRYACVFIQSRLRKRAEGRFLMEMRLAEKRVDPISAKKALDEYYQMEQTIEYVREAYQQELRKADRQKALFLLRQRGFNSYEIRMALEGVEQQE